MSVVPMDPHSATAEDLSRTLRTDPAVGLGEAVADQRLVEYGPNVLPSDGGTSSWKLLRSQFANVLIVILIIAIALSAFLGHVTEAVVIGVIALFSVGLGFIQEFRAERALEALRKLASPEATVIREGRARKIPSMNVVPGDLIALAAGDVVPADGRLTEVANLRVDEASLTGESLPVGKHADTLAPEEVPVGDRRNMVFGSTNVTYGRGRAIVVSTGRGTEVGKIGTMLRTVEASTTPLQANLQRVGRALAWGAGGVVLLVAGMGIMQGRPPLEIVIFAIALAVAVVPEALPAVVTISLALGARLMAKRNALIRRLPSVETLGSVTVICSDKTGTLTTGEMTVRELYTPGDILHVTGAGYAPEGRFQRGGVDTVPGPGVLELLEAATLSTDAELVDAPADDQRRMVGDPTEAALLVAGAKAGLLKRDLEARFPRVAEIPFSSERKRMTTVHGASTGGFSISKGAPEIILSSCDRIRSGATEVTIEEVGREGILSVAREMGSRALRVIAVARRSGVDPQCAETRMTFLGLLGMIDPPRSEARAAVEQCSTAGIRPVMITGDHPITARAIAAELGLLRRGGIVTGLELDAMSDAELDHRVLEIDVYARVSPAHKLRVVAALQRQGEVCAMTGDGVNDAPALKKADVGIAMGIAGTDVSKGAADVILTDDNFATIIAAVEEGRAIFDNIKKYLMYLLSSNAGEILLMVSAVALGLPLPMTAVQLLYVNLATDGLPALALAFDPHAGDLMRRRPRRAEAGIFTRPVTVLILVGGIWSALVNVSLFAWALGTGRPLTEAVTMTFVSLVIIQLFKAYSFRSERHSILVRPFANRWLNLAVVWELGLLALVLYVPFLAAAFESHRLTLVDWLVLVPAAFTIVPILETAKWMVRRRWFGDLA